VTATAEHDWTHVRTVLPPRPQLVDFAFGGAACGLLLAAAESALLWLDSEALPPRLAFLAVACEALLGAALATLLGVGLRALRRRPTHSALAGALVAPLLVLPAAAAHAAGLGWRASGAALVLAVVAGVLAARTGTRLERAGFALSAPFVLAPAAALLALSEAGSGGLARLPGGTLAPWLLGIAAALTLAYGISLLGPRERSAPSSWGRLLVSSAVLAALAASLPILAPFLALDPASGPPGPDVPASGLLLDLGVTPAGTPRNAGLDATRMVALASDGVRYDAVIPSEPDVDLADALLSGSDTPVLAALAARGYATAAVTRSPERVAALGASEVDAAPGPAGRLRETAPRMVGAALLLALPPPLARTLRIDAALRSDTELAQDAAAWLARWRTSRSRVPFFLVVDFADAPSPPADDALGRLLDPLRDLDAGRSTLLLAGARDEPLGASGAFHLVVVPPAVATRAPRGLRVLGGVDAGELRELLRSLPEGRADQPFALPAAGVGTLEDGAP